MTLREMIQAGFREGARWDVTAFRDALATHRTARASPSAPPPEHWPQTEILGQITAASDDSPTEIFLYDAIGVDYWGDGIASSDIVREVVDRKDEPLRIRINSAGGSVWEGFAIYEALRQHVPDVEVQIDGLAASIASVIAMAGDPIRISPVGMVMIHSPMGGVWGTARDHRKMATTLDRVQGSMIAAYRTRTSASTPQLEDWLAEETYFTPTAASRPR